MRNLFLSKTVVRQRLSKFQPTVHYWSIPPLPFHVGPKMKPGQWITISIVSFDLCCIHRIFCILTSDLRSEMTL